MNLSFARELVWTRSPTRRSDRAEQKPDPLVDQFMTFVNASTSCCSIDACRSIAAEVRLNTLLLEDNPARLRQASRMDSVDHTCCRWR